MAHTKRLANQIIFVVVSMIFILGFGIDLYSPSFPSIARSLKTTNQLVQLTISTYFFGYVLGLILLGPVSDAIGRKKPLLIGLIFYAIMSILCSFSTNIYMLLFLRMLQGVGVSIVGLGFRSIFSDVFTGKRLATAMSYSSMSYRIGPIIAPFIGGYLETYFGWQSNFYFLAAFGMFVFCLVAFFLPETHLELLQFHPKLIFHRYLTILKHRAFLGGALCIGILYAMMIIFNVVGPFFIQNILHYSPISYGHIAFMIGIATFIGILTNRILLHYKTSQHLVAFGIYTLIILCGLQVLFAHLFPTNLYCFVIPVTLVLYMTGFVNANMTSYILELIPYGKGTASALLGALLITCTGILVTFSSFLKSNTIRPFSYAYLALIIGCFFSYQFLYKSKN